MKRATQGWIERAEGDFRAAHLLLVASEPVLEAVCFHAQQCAQKYLKALLQEHEIHVPRLHDLVILAQHSAPLLPQLAEREVGLAELNAYAVEIRYPGSSVEQIHAEAAVQIAEAVRRLIPQALGLQNAMN